MVTENTEIKIPKRILNTLLSSLSAGVVPRNGAPYIAIGRQDEIGSLLDNLSDVSEGGSFCRFLIGRYGSGKSFLIQLIRGYALERGFITADADLSPERRLSGGSGAGLATYRELMTNLASKASPEGLHPTPRSLTPSLKSAFISLFQSLKEGLTALTLQRCWVNITPRRSVTIPTKRAHAFAIYAENLQQRPRRHQLSASV